jgi:hypothetical protein
MTHVPGQGRVALIAQIAIGRLNNQDHSITADDLPSLLIKIGEGTIGALVGPVAGNIERWGFDLAFPRCSSCCCAACGRG